MCSSAAGACFEVGSLEAAIEEMSKQEQQAAAECTAGSMASSSDIEASTPPNVIKADVSQISLAHHPHAATQAWLQSILMHTDGDQVAAALAECESKKVTITDWRSNPRSPSHTSTCCAHTQPLVHKSARCLHKGAR